MQVFEQVCALKEQVRHWKSEGLRIGFVPTMGNLHAGHLSLAELAKQKADRVVVSIFVNPLQFGPDEDFERYPRTFEADCEQLQAHSVDALFFPQVDEMYPSGTSQTRVIVPDALTGLLEGKSRPGHFDGVTTVVAKLFNVVQPDVAVFGQKDFQQYAVIERMVTDLAMPVELVRAPIAREEDGLALSSRNQYLNEAQRQIAPKLYTVLCDVATALESGNRNFSDLESVATQSLLAEGFDAVDYIAIVDPLTLLPAVESQTRFAVLAVARMGATRLLDNILVTSA
ncbi:pantoate--beta-alanine ligase [Thiomicrorhabdus sp. zzn3]|uniref:pantoate--beta-alanine ligase n=1 Tax=Thiomicrorhabdus sp. zzn3 TaxID=3039775 RepID=UPI002436DC31|nr:pantoate--beta-alanine ligase [Thiomicrorhabdus sp. zzn3]MDG6777567.1 pantoate--beta-alanine ligase [Thiomicrorhabdus sp. zzn3]